MQKWFQLFFILCCSFVVVSMGHAATAKNIDQIIAIVNTSVITQSELNQAIHKIKKQLVATHNTLPNEQALQKRVLDQLINRKLQLELAAQMGIKVSEQDIDNAIQSIATNNHLTINRLYTEVARQGLSKKEYREEIRDEFTIHKVEQQALAGKIRISSEEVDDYMRSAAWMAFNGKEYHLEDILITLPESPSNEQIAVAKARANHILQKIHQGISFQEASLVSQENDRTFQQAGDLGWRKLPEIPSAFSDKLIAAKENDILGPIQTGNGFHILYVAGVRNITMKGGLDAQRKKVQALLYEHKFEEKLEAWITEIHNQAYINLHPMG